MCLYMPCTGIVFANYIHKEKGSVVKKSDKTSFSDETAVDSLASQVFRITPSFSS